MENKTGNYFKYAIGEIIIVVIGILFVLFANYMKEQSDNKEFKIKALQALKNDVSKDLKELEFYWMIRLSDQENAHYRLKEFLNNSEPIIDSAQFLTDIILVSTYFTFNQNSTTIEDLINGDKFNLINNDSLRKALLGYKNGAKGIAESDIIHRAYFTEVYGKIGPKLSEGTGLIDGFMAYHNGDTATLKIAASRSFNISKIRKSDYLRELLIATWTPFKVQHNGYISLKSESEELLRLLNDAINDK